MAERLLGADFLLHTGRSSVWGPPVPLGGPPPVDTEWLVAAHRTSTDGTRHLGLDDGLRLILGPLGHETGDIEPIDGSGDATGGPADGFAVDAVFTWVDFDDPAWRQRLAGPIDRTTWSGRRRQSRGSTT